MHALDVCTPTVPHMVDPPYCRPSLSGQSLGGKQHRRTWALFPASRPHVLQPWASIPSCRQAVLTEAHEVVPGCQPTSSPNRQRSKPFADAFSALSAGVPWSGPTRLQPHLPGRHNKRDSCVRPVLGQLHGRGRQGHKQCEGPATCLMAGTDGSWQQGSLPCPAARCCARC